MGSVDQNKLENAAEDTRRAKQGEPPDRKVWWFNQKAPIDRFTGWLMVYTFCLVVATLANAWVLFETDWTLRKTLEATKVAADAAKKSADVAELSLTRLERPHLFLDKLTITQVFDEQFPYLPRMQGVFTNAGKSPAILVECLYWKATYKQSQAERVYEPTSPIGTHCGSSGEMVAAGQSSQLAYFMPVRVGPENLREIYAFTRNVILYGEFSYEDVFEKVHTEGFGFLVVVPTPKSFEAELKFREDPETIRRGLTLAPNFYRMPEERYQTARQCAKGRVCPPGQDCLRPVRHTGQIARCAIIPGLTPPAVISAGTGSAGRSAGRRS